MKKIIGICLMVIVCTGCLVYGQGKEVCYISSVDDGFFWGLVSTKTDLSSSDADIYIVAKDNEYLRTLLLKVAEQKQRVKIIYKKHSFSLSESNNDEIIDVELIQG